MDSPGLAWAKALVTAVAVALADQLAKSWVRADIVVGERRKFAWPLDLVHVNNRGVAFGILGGGGWIVPVLTLVALLAVLIWFGRHPTASFAWLPCGLVLGGALGNLWDRLLRGQVTDFLKLPHWPAFNLADVAITLGVIILVVVAEADGRSRNTSDS